MTIDGGVACINNNLYISLSVTYPLSYAVHIVRESTCIVWSI